MANGDTGSNLQNADCAEMHKGLRLLHQPGSVVELRSLDTGRAGTVSGYFDDFERLTRAAA
jgi:hypothetical protein